MCLPCLDGINFIDNGPMTLRPAPAIALGYRGQSALRLLTRHFVKLHGPPWDLFLDAELAKLSLSGRKFPTKHDGKAKQKLSENVKLSITEFLIDRWKVWHGAKLDQRSVNSAFTARFGGAHTIQRKHQGAKPTSRVDDPDENIFLNGPARKKGGENFNTGGVIEFDFNEVDLYQEDEGGCAQVINTNEY